jgi:hypothetical protein
MECPQCGNRPPGQSRFCNVCGRPLVIGAAPSVPPASVERRWIYVDLADLKLPLAMSKLDDRAAAVSYVYERFTPFADDGWEWVVHPASTNFSGWVAQELESGRPIIAGANLLCRRVRVGAAAVLDPGHHVGEHRLRQLAERPWTAEAGSKVWRRAGGDSGEAPAGKVPVVQPDDARFPHV